MNEVVIPETVRTAIDNGALVVLNDSGGKDSQAMRILLQRVLPPTAAVIVVHAALGEVEWPGALEHAAAGARRSGYPFHVARAQKTFLEMVERRFQTRPSVPSWPSAAYRQCTSDLKRDPIAKLVRGELAARGLTRVVNCLGLRAEESAARRVAPPVKLSQRHSTAARQWWDWLPIHDLSLADVRATVEAAGEELHPAYRAGNDRLSCMLCIMGSRADLERGARANPALYRQYVDLERKTGYTMHQSGMGLEELTGLPAGADDEEEEDDSSLAA